MLRITVIAVGRLKERFWTQACDDYLKRLSAYAKVKVIELADTGRDRECAEIVARLSALGPDAHAILLDIDGSPTSSEALAAKVDRLQTRGISHVAFVIGGSDGVDAAVRAAAAERLSFGPITLPHNLARVVLLEQVYRAFRIIRGEPYHK